MKIKFLSSLVVMTLMLFISCGENTNVVESGTYQGTISEVEASKTEIYVETEDDQTLELYFTDETSLTRNGNPVEFSVLEEGMQVEVEVSREGKRLDPISVKVLD